MEKDKIKISTEKISADHPEPTPEKPNEIPQPGRGPEIIPNEPEPGAWPHKDPEIQPGKEPPPIPHVPPQEIPSPPQSANGHFPESSHNYDASVTVKNQKKIAIRKIRKRYKDCIDEIKTHFFSKETISATVIHDLRVNLKRIDALISLLAFAGIEPPAKKVKAFKLLFRTAGRLRSVQVEFDVIKKYFHDDSLNPGYLHQLHENKAKRLEKYKTFLEKGLSQSLKDAIKTLKKSTASLTRTHVRKYMRAEEKKLTRQLRRSIFREQELHIVRKDLKRFYLNLKIAEHEQVQLEHFLDVIGQWHDHQLAFDHVIRAIHTGKFTEPESEPIKKIKLELIRDKENLYEEIVAFYSKQTADQ